KCQDADHRHRFIEQQPFGSSWKTVAPRGTLGLNGFYDQVVDGPVDTLKPMRHSCGDHDHVAFFELVDLRIRDLLGGQLQGTIGPARMSVYGSTPHKERRTSIHHVEDIRLFYVDLNVAILDAPIGLHFVGAVAWNQQRLLSKLVEYLLAIDVGGSTVAQLGGLAGRLHHHERRERGHTQYCCSHYYFLLRNTFASTPRDGTQDAISAIGPRTRKTSIGHPTSNSLTPAWSPSFGPRSAVYARSPRRVL